MAPDREEEIISILCWRNKIYLRV